MLVRWRLPDGPPPDRFTVLNAGSELGSVPGSATSFVVEDLVPGATYGFRVIALAGDRRSYPSPEAFATFLAPSPGEVAWDPATATLDSITITWTPPAGAPAPNEYTVIRGGNPVATVPGAETSYTDTGLLPATDYPYRVRASWGFELSEPTPIVVARTLEPPVEEARLTGAYEVTITIDKAPGGGSLTAGTSWSDTWTIVPACDAGPCDVTVEGSIRPPGFTRHDFTMPLAREAGNYSGRTAAHITHCQTVDVTNDLTLRLTVETSGVDESSWVARTWSGTLTIASPYTKVGGYYCPAQSVTATVTGSR
jgi:hypothetical protein